jgi:hypothetical protein
MAATRDPVAFGHAVVELAHARDHPVGAVLIGLIAHSYGARAALGAGVIGCLNAAIVALPILLSDRPSPAPHIGQPVACALRRSLGAGHERLPPKAASACTASPGCCSPVSSSVPISGTP